MSTAGIWTWLPAALGGLAAGGAVAFLATRGVYVKRLAEAALRQEHLQRVRDQTNELLLQARRQADMLSKELDLMRRQQALQRVQAGPAPSPATAPAAPVIVAAAAREQPDPATGFSDTVVNPRG